MTNSINNGIPFVPENTIDPAAGLNLSINVIDALLQCRVLTVGDNALPVSEAAEGDRYIVGTTPTGDWAGQANKLARYLDAGWHFYDANIVLNDADGFVYKKNSIGAWSRSSVMAGSYAWSDVPSAAGLPADSLIYVNDFPNAYVGSWWRALPDYGIYSPLAGDMLVASVTNRDVIDSASEQVIDFLPVIPAALILPGATKFVIDAHIAKDTGAIACTYRIRVGDTGTTSDPVVHTVAIGATARSARINSSLNFTASDAVTVCPTPSGEYGESTTVWPSDVTIPDVTTDPVYITLTMQFASTGGTATVKNATCNMQLI